MEKINKLKTIIESLRSRVEIQRLINKLNGDIIRIKDDESHYKKRSHSFVLFDCLLEGCQENECLISIIDYQLAYLLFDISLDGYLMEKAYYFYEKNGRQDDKLNYYNAEKLIKKVLDCKKNPAFQQDIFRIDSKELINRNYNNIAYYGARKRKAYWTFLKDYPKNEPTRDYCNSSKFIAEIHTLSNQHNHDEKDVENIKKLITQNYHIANPIDLYRVCLIRKKMLEKSS